MDIGTLVAILSAIKIVKSKGEAYSIKTASRIPVRLDLQSRIHAIRDIRAQYGRIESDIRETERAGPGQLEYGLQGDVEVCAGVRAQG